MTACSVKTSDMQKEAIMSDKYLDTIVVNRGNQRRLKNVMLRNTFLKKK